MMLDAQDGTPLLHLVVLAIVQGITEFLPISSSAHLILMPVFIGWADQGLALDAAMHIGTLLAVVLYFRRDVATLLGGVVDVARRRSTPAARLALQIIAATVPVVVAGFLLKDRIEGDWRSPVLIMVTTAAFCASADPFRSGWTRTCPGLRRMTAAPVGLRCLRTRRSGSA